MIKVNYQMFGSGGLKLRLRCYLDGETRYVNVNGKLHGELQRKHWNAAKQCLRKSAPFCDQNNGMLMAFRKPYDLLALNWDGTIDAFMLAARGRVEESEEWTLADAFAWSVKEAKRRMNEDGTLSGTFEVYLKGEKKIKEYCAARGLDWDRLTLDRVDYTLVEDIFDWLRVEKRNRAALSTSQMLRATLVRADKKGKYDFKRVEGCHWIGKKKKSAAKYETLTEEQCRRLVKMPVEELPGSANRQLFRDFCVFMLTTCQSPCDVVCMKYDNIQVINGMEHMVFKRRKIGERQNVDCSVPVSAEMKAIMERWKGKSKDGYIFPVRSEERIRRSQSNNADIKHLIGRLNHWLKKLGEMLGCPFPLHNYVFRHTGITRYVSHGVPIIYVANLAGTSVENCEKIYYNNQGDTASRDKVLAAACI